MRRRASAQNGPDERAWSAHTSVHPRAARADLVPYMSLPAETGPMWAPDCLSVWPVEGGRYGIDAHYQGHSGIERANGQQQRLKKVGLSATLKRDADGGVTLLIQNESPGKDKEANWLPAPKGPFNLTMRLYGPKSDALTGRWNPPPITKIHSVSNLTAQ